MISALKTHWWISVVGHQALVDDQQKTNPFSSIYKKGEQSIDVAGAAALYSVVLAADEQQQT